MKYLKLSLSLLLGLTAASNAVLAQTAYVARQANMLAGPGTEYQAVAILMPGVMVEVQGCLTDYHWCDVVTGPNRGWVYGGNISYPYQGGNVPLISYGTAIGVGIVAFSVGNYWDRHYVGRPWYPQRQLWINRPPPPYSHNPPGPQHRPPAPRQPAQHSDARHDGPHLPPQGQAAQGEPQSAPRPRGPKGDHRPARDREQGGK
ncbi:MAG: SH3 domain-containing protein [Rhodoferax sp.]